MEQITIDIQLDPMKDGIKVPETDVSRPDAHAVILGTNGKIRQISMKEAETILDQMATCEADGTWNSEEYTYYADGYVTDSQGLPVSPEDVIRCIGTEFPNWFGTYEDDQIWIRNDELRIDFSFGS